MKISSLFKSFVIAGQDSNLRLVFEKKMMINVCASLICNQDRLKSD